LGRPAGVAAALVALLSYSFLQVGLYEALGPAAATDAATHLHWHAPWWAWALGAWALITVLGLARVEITALCSACCFRMRPEANSAFAIRIVNPERVPGAGIKAFPCNLQEVYSAIFGPGPAVGCEEGSFLGAGKLARPGLGESQTVQRVVGGMVEEEPAGVVRDGLVQVRGDLGRAGHVLVPSPRRDHGKSHAAIEGNLDFRCIPDRY
jgi:hypothetical protein